MTVACLHQLFEAQARSRPKAVAVRAEGTSLTYGELDRRSNQLANLLPEALGVQPGRVVAIAMPRSLGLVTSALAVLKAGAAYLPLDPADPADRIRSLLDDAQAAAVLTTSAVALPAGDRPTAAVDGDVLAAKIGRRPALVPTLRAAPGSPACVIATSGTTGRPKCVVLTHGGLVSKIRWEHADLGVGAHDRFLQLASVGFSVAVLELFSPLSAGAELVLGPTGLAREARTIGSQVSRHGVTVLSLVPSELRLLLEPGADVDWSSVRLVITGGEPLPGAVSEHFLSAHPGISLVNLYGMTESSVDTTWWPCRPRPDGGAVPIGRPVPGADVHVLDDDLREVPPGATGELYVGGDNLALGYAARPALTAHRFVPDPFRPGGRLYRSGDLARQLPDGTLELLGRRDLQVQVNGIRIELEEIEAALCGHPAVSQATVVLRQHPRTTTMPGDEAGWARLLSGIGGQELNRVLADIESRPA